MTYFALIPAAGQGSRIGGTLPKQYLPLVGHAMLWHTIKNLYRHPAIQTVFIVLSPEDESYTQQDWSSFEQKLAPLYCGGATRHQSVLNGLIAASDMMNPDDWVLVHDAARPCLQQNDLNNLMQQCDQDPIGGLLATPVADTLKRTDTHSRIIKTEPRHELWQAQTPQMFRVGMLIEALRLSLKEGVTDEAQAIEKLGYQPKLVLSSRLNLKITYPEDLEMAAFILSAHDNEQTK